MEGLSKADVEARELASKPLRPRDAASLILIDRRGGEYFVLMGRRHKGHAFMPDRFVFPGGRTDPTDSRIRVASDLHPKEEEKLMNAGRRVTAARARAIALSAIRETYEEAGLLIGREGPFVSPNPHWREFETRQIQPSLEKLRYFARAITPPGRVRRFDTRFLAAWRDDVAVELADGGPTDELQEIAWLPLEEAMEADVPRITRTILGELKERLAVDPQLEPGGPVPFYFMRGKRFRREVL
ncbi:NUDIX hydrolase [Chelativorans sp. YIM 93263]|uniref:NUDIX hydrolase n=1 Tax=Chelativorans sp. YIM 93263 TaxID=2906648 RepID=UPI002378CC00|nr:NUDIX domain-containing protein [Chelativorans sp. YIM 93263]